MHDLDPVAVGDRGRGIGRARHDLEVALDRDLARIEAQRGDQAGDVAEAGKAALLAVDQKPPCWPAVPLPSPA